MEVIGVGDADIDIYLDLDHIPGRDEKVLARTTHFHPGGMVANFLVALRRLGTTCGYHGPVGDDEFGRLTLADLQANGVDTEGAIIKQGERTYFCVVMLDGSGEKSLVVAPTACLSPEADDLSAPTIARARHLHTAVASLATLRLILEIARGHHLTTSVDIEPDMVVDPAMTRALLPLIDILFIGQEAAQRLAGAATVEETATALQVAGAGTVCLTMGRDGAVVAEGGRPFHVAAYPVKVVDSTGAGDCYAAGFVHGFLNGWPASRSATFAAAVGALAVQGYGGHDAAPAFEAVERFLDDRGIDLNRYQSQSSDDGTGWECR